jgi:hypothetical protein
MYIIFFESIGREFKDGTAHSRTSPCEYIHAYSMRLEKGFVKRGNFGCLTLKQTRLAKIKTSPDDFILGHWVALSNFGAIFRPCLNFLAIVSSSSKDYSGW